MRGHSPDSSNKLTAQVKSIAGAVTTLDYVSGSFVGLAQRLSRMPDVLGELACVVSQIGKLSTADLLQREMQRYLDRYQKLGELFSSSADRMTSLLEQIERRRADLGAPVCSEARQFSPMPASTGGASNGSDRVKAKTNHNKVVTAAQAVERYIKPGTCLCIGGFGYTRLPMTLIREIIRRQIGELFVTTCGAAAAMEFLAANRLIKWLDTTYLGLEGLQPVAFNLRTQIENCEIEVIEDYDNCSFAARAQAARYGWPFAPVMCSLGSDLLNYDNFGSSGLRGRKKDGSWVHPSIPPKRHVVIDDPFEGWGLQQNTFRDGDCADEHPNPMNEVSRCKAYTGKEGVKVVLVPPLLPEVAIIRAQVVGEEGTVRIEGVLGSDVEQAMAAKHLIVECEKIVSEFDLGAVPETNTIPMHFVDAIVEQPFGGYPSCVPGYYDYDWDYWVDYCRINRRDRAESERWWREHVIDTADDWEFLSRRMDGKRADHAGKPIWQRLFELRVDPQYRYKPDLERTIPSVGL